MALNPVIVWFNLHQLLGGDFDPRRTKAYVTTNVENGTLIDTSTGEVRMGDQAVTINSDGTGEFETWSPGLGYGNPVTWQTSLVVDYPRAGQRDRTKRVFGPYTVVETNRTITTKALTSNVATLTVSEPHGLRVGDSVTVYDVDATFNGAYTITAVPTPSSLSYAKTASNVASTAVTVGNIGSEYVSLALLEDEQAIPPNYQTAFTESMEEIRADAEAARDVALDSIDGLGVGTVTTGAAGSPVVVTLTGTAPDRDFNFTIPKGDQGLPGPGAAAWTASQAVVVGSVRQAPDGSWIKSTAARTTRTTFDATEQGFWTAVLATPGTIEQAALTASYAQAINVYPTVSHGIGSGDDTAYLQAKLDMVAPAIGLTNVVIHGGTWMIDGVNEAMSTHFQRYVGGGLKPKAGTTLVLSDAAILKIIPNDSPGYACISLEPGQDDVTIRGGKILGDRATHDYVSDTSSPTHEWGMGISARGVDHLIVEDLEIDGCAGDAIRLGCLGTDKTAPDYNPTTNIHIYRCTLTNSRRNNISVTGTDRYWIEDCYIANAGINDGIHDGTSPRAGIDLEYGTSQAIIHGTIRKNVFVGNVGSAVNIFNATDTKVEGNWADTPIAWGNNAHRAKIADNTLYSVTPLTVSVAAIGGTSSGSSDIIIEGNEISGFSTGIRLPVNAGVARNNYVERFTAEGILVYTTTSAEVAGNTVLGDKSSTSQIGIRVVGSTDTKVKNNVVDGCYYGLRYNTIAGTGTCMVSANTFVDCYYSARADIDVTMLLIRNTFRPGGHGAGVGTDVVWVQAAGMIATKNEHYGSSLAYSGANVGTTKSRVFDNLIDGVTGANAIALSGTSGKHQVIRNTIIGNRPSGTAGEAITITGADGSLVIGNIAWSEGAVAFTRLVKSSGSTNTTIRRNDFDGATLATSHASDIVDNNTRLGVATTVSGVPLTAYKAANTTRNNTAAKTADPDLTVTVEANSVYLVEGWIEYEATTTADVSVAWTVPTSATLPWSTGGLISTATTSSSGTARGRIASGNSGTFGGVGAGTVVEGRIAGLLTTSATAGTVALTWAQASAEVSDAILYAGSWIKLTKVA